MKKIIFVFVLSFLAMTLVSAQTFNPKSGDPQFDNDLIELNKKAKSNIDGFKSDIKTRFGIAHDRIEKMLDIYKMEPADVFMAAKVGQLTSKEPEIVCQSFQKNREKGWGVIAKEMGIKPGSPEFHELKNASKGKGNSSGPDKGNKGGKGKGNGSDKGNKGGKGNSKGGEKEKGNKK
jgi:hypothetical protein